MVIDSFALHGSVLHLLADQEIRLIKGLLFVGETYEVDAGVVALSGSRRTESIWIRTRVYAPGSNSLLATMLINSAWIKDSYSNLVEEILPISVFLKCFERSGLNLL